MNINTLEKKLLEEGCNPTSFSISIHGSSSDGFCLSKKGWTWQIYFSERGIDSNPIYKSLSESKACKVYFDKIMKIQHRHLVGFFESADRAIQLQQEFESKGINTIRNDMGPMRKGGPNIKRVFVVGKDIFWVRNKYKDLPLKDA